MSEGIFKKLEKTSVIFKLVAASAGLYFVYRQWKKQQLEDISLPALPAGATVPLVSQGVNPLPSAGVQNVLYGGISPDQVNAISAVPTTGMQPLDPNVLAQQAVLTGSSLLQQALVKKNAA